MTNLTRCGITPAPNGNGNGNRNGNGNVNVNVDVNGNAQRSDGNILRPELYIVKHSNKYIFS